MLPRKVHLHSHSKETMSTLNAAGRRRRTVDNVWPYRALSIAKRDIKKTSILTAACCKQSSLRPSCSVTRENARGSANGHLTNQDDGQLEEWSRCSLYRLSRLFSCLRISIIRLPRQEWVQCFHSTLALPAYHVMELSLNKVFDNEERKKRQKTILHFPLQAVSNSGNTATSVKHCNSFGSTQEYLVSIYISKKNL